MNDYYVASAAQGLLGGISMVCFVFLFLMLIAGIFKYLNHRKEEKRKLEFFRKLNEK